MRVMTRASRGARERDDRGPRSYVRHRCDPSRGAGHACAKDPYDVTRIYFSRGYRKCRADTSSARRTGRTNNVLRNIVHGEHVRILRLQTLSVTGAIRVNIIAAADASVKIRDIRTVGAYIDWSDTAARAHVRLVKCVCRLTVSFL